MKNNKQLRREPTGSKSELRKLASKYVEVPAFQIGVGYGIVWAIENYPELIIDEKMGKEVFASDLMKEAIKDLNDK